MNNYLQELTQQSSRIEKELERIKKKDLERANLVSLLSLENLQPYIQLLEEKEFKFNSSLMSESLYNQINKEDLSRFNLLFYKKYPITNSISDVFFIGVYLEETGKVTVGVCTDASCKYSPNYVGEIYELDNPTIEDLSSHIDKLFQLKQILIYPKVTRFQMPAFLSETECRSFMDDWFFQHGVWHMEIPNWEDGNAKEDDDIILEDDLTLEEAKSIINSGFFEN